MRHGILLLASLLLFGACGAAPATVDAEPGGRGLGRERRDATAAVYVLFGQSNAEGYAPTAGLPPDLRRPIAGCLVWHPIAGGFAPLCGGVNGRTLTAPDWCGPELTLARSLTANGDTIHLVKVAVGQTALGPTPGPANEWDADSGELYAILQTAITNACADLRTRGLTPRVRGICMMQGESDATDASWARGYRARLGTLVRRFRNDLLQAQLAADDAVPFVIGRIDRNLPADVFPFTALVRDAQAGTAGEHPACAAIDTSGLPMLADLTHFDTAGVIALGERFAAALKELQPVR